MRIVAFHSRKLVGQLVHTPIDVRCIPVWNHPTFFFFFFFSDLLSKCTLQVAFSALHHFPTNAIPYVYPSHANLIVTCMCSLSSHQYSSMYSIHCRICSSQCALHLNCALVLMLTSMVTQRKYSSSSNSTQHLCTFSLSHFLSQIAHL